MKLWFKMKYINEARIRLLRWWRIARLTLAIYVLRSAHSGWSCLCRATCSLSPRLLRGFAPSSLVAHAPLLPPLVPLPPFFLACFTIPPLAYLLPLARTACVIRFVRSFSSFNSRASHSILPFPLQHTTIHTPQSTRHKQFLRVLSFCVNIKIWRSWTKFHERMTILFSRRCCVKRIFYSGL